MQEYRWREDAFAPPRIGRDEEESVRDLGKLLLMFVITAVSVAVIMLSRTSLEFSRNEATALRPSGFMTFVFVHGFHGIGTGMAYDAGWPSGRTVSSGAYHELPRSARGLERAWREDRREQPAK